MTFGMDAHPVTHAELDVMPVEHGHFLLFGICRGVALAGPALLRAAVEDGCAVGGLHTEFGLEEPSLVPRFLGLFLAVDQEEGDGPEMIPLSQNPLHLHLEEFRIGDPTQPAGLDRDGVGNAAARAALPDQLVLAARGGERGATVPVVMAPARGDLKLLASRLMPKVIPKEEGNMVLEEGRMLPWPHPPLCRCHPAGDRRTLRVKAPGFWGPASLPGSGPGRCFLVDLLFLAADRAEQVVEDHLLKFVPDLHRGGNTLQNAGHGSGTSFLGWLPGFGVGLVRPVRRIGISALQHPSFTIGVNSARVGSEVSTKARSRKC